MVGRPPGPRNIMTHREIRELLVLKEWSREELAEKLGITRNTIDKWFVENEQHRRHPSLDHVQKMRTWLAEARHECRTQLA